MKEGTPEGGTPEGGTPEGTVMSIDPCLWVYGPMGVGKSNLVFALAQTLETVAMHATTCFSWAYQDSQTVLYIDSLDFAPRQNLMCLLYTQITTLAVDERKTFVCMSHDAPDKVFGLLWLPLKPFFVVINLEETLYGRQMLFEPDSRLTLYQRTLGLCRSLDPREGSLRRRLAHILDGLCITLLKSQDKSQDKSKDEALDKGKN